MPTLQGSLNRKLVGLFSSKNMHPKTWMSIWVEINERKSLVARMLSRRNGGIIVHSEGDNEVESEELIGYLTPKFFESMNGKLLFDDALAHNYIFLRMSETNGVKVIEVSAMIASSTYFWYWDVAKSQFIETD